MMQNFVALRVGHDLQWGATIIVVVLDLFAAELLDAGWHATPGEREHLSTAGAYRGVGPEPSAPTQGRRLKLMQIDYGMGPWFALALARSSRLRAAAADSSSRSAR